MTTDTASTDIPIQLVTSTFLTCVAEMKPLEVSRLPDGRIELRINKDTVLHLSAASARQLHSDLGVVLA